MDDLAARALELARVHLADGGQMLPFALVATGDKLTCTTIVTERSDTALILGRRIVKDQRDADSYALCVDAFARVGGERRDAVFVETAVRGDRAARVTAHPYRAGGAFEAALDVERRPSALTDWDPYTLDWGGITVDLYNADRKLSVHSIFHELGTPEDVARTVRFVRARTRHHARHLPAGTQQLVHVEDRGRVITTREALRSGIGTAAEVIFASERH